MLLDYNSVGKNEYTRKIDVRCRAISYDIYSGCSLIPNDVMRRLIISEQGTVKLHKPYNDKSFSVNYDEHYSIKDLTRDVCKHLGITNGGAVYILIRIDDVTLISFDDERTALQDIINNFDKTSLDVYLFVMFGLGEIFREKGFRFYIPAREGRQHNQPHVHVEAKDGRRVSIDIATLEPLTDGMKPHELTKIKKMLKGWQEKLLQAWNLKSDGMDVDINFLLGLTKIAGVD